MQEKDEQSSEKGFLILFTRTKRICPLIGVSFTHLFSVWLMLPRTSCNHIHVLLSDSTSNLKFLWLVVGTEVVSRISGNKGTQAKLLFQRAECHQPARVRSVPKGWNEAAGFVKPYFPQSDHLKAVIFDVDGTLCDSDPLHYTAFAELLQEGGKPISEEFYINHITGRDDAEVIKHLFPVWDNEKCAKFMEKKEARFRSLARKLLKPVEGLEGLCEWIKQNGLQRAAVTNAPRENAELMISLLGLTNFFEILVVGSECERAKPFPDPYLKALGHFSLSPDQALVFEDSPTGLKAAVSADMAAVGVATRNPEESLLKAGALFVISNFKEPKLWDLLQGKS